MEQRYGIITPENGYTRVNHTSKEVIRLQALVGERQTIRTVRDCRRESSGNVGNGPTSGQSCFGSGEPNASLKVLRQLQGSALPA